MQMNAPNHGDDAMLCSVVKEAINLSQLEC